MNENPLADRGTALENLFFAREEAAARQRGIAAQATEQRRQAFAEALGIGDGALLERLLDLGIGPDTLAALMVVPVVAVAWADGDINDAERNAVLFAAADAGLDVDGAGYRLLGRWLAERPPAELFAAWKDYVQALSTSMSTESRQSLRSEILRRVRGTADATGGFLGFGRKVSEHERSVLTEVRNALSD
jgi:hypothetical protein